MTLLMDVCCLVSIVTLLKEDHDLKHHQRLEFGGTLAASCGLISNVAFLTHLFFMPTLEFHFQKHLKKYC